MTAKRPQELLSGNYMSISGFHLGFLSREGKHDNSRVKGGAKTIVCFSFCEEGRCAH